jgi:hypothetical protein
MQPDLHFYRDPKIWLTINCSYNCSGKPTPVLCNPHHEYIEDSQAFFSSSGVGESIFPRRWDKHGIREKKLECSIYYISAVKYT